MVLNSKGSPEQTFHEYTISLKESSILYITKTLFLKGNIEYYI